MDKYILFDAATFPVLYYSLYIYSDILLLFYLYNTGRPLKIILCGDLILFKIAINIILVYFTFFVWSSFIEIQAGILEPVLSKHMEYYNFWMNSIMSKSYVFGTVLLLIILDWFISLKPTRLWGPFANIIKLAGFRLLPFLLLFLVIIIAASLFIFILFAENPDSCQNVFTCFLRLI